MKVPGITLFKYSYNKQQVHNNEQTSQSCALANYTLHTHAHSISPQLNFTQRETNSNDKIQKVSNATALAFIKMSLENSFRYNQDQPIELQKIKDLLNILKPTENHKFTIQELTAFINIIQKNKSNIVPYPLENIAEQMHCFYNPDNTFNPTYFEKFLKYANSGRYHDLKYLFSLANLGKDKNGLHPEVFDLLQTEPFFDKLQIHKNFKIDDELNIELVKSLNNILKASSYFEMKSLLQNSFNKFLECSKDKQGKNDTAALKFFNEITTSMKHSPKNWGTIIDFVNTSKDNEGKYNPEFTPIFKNLTRLNYDINNILKVTSDEDEDRLEIFKKIDDLINYLDDKKIYSSEPAQIEKNDFVENLVSYTDVVAEDYKKLFDIFGQKFTLNDYNKLVLSCNEINNETIDLINEIFNDDNHTEAQHDFFRNLNRHDDTIDYKAKEVVQKYQNKHYQLSDLVELAHPSSDVIEINDVAIANFDKVIELFDYFKKHDPNNKIETWVITRILRNIIITKPIGRIDDEKIDWYKYLAKEFNSDNVLKLIETFRYKNSLQFEQFQKLTDCAKSNKQILREGTEDLTNEDINHSFCTNINGILNAHDLLGDELFKYAFKLKLTNFETFIDELANLNTAQKNQFVAQISPKLHPLQAEKYNTLLIQLEKEKHKLALDAPYEQKKLEANNKILISQYKAELSNLKKQLNLGEDTSEIKSKIFFKTQQIKNLNYETQVFYNTPEIQPQVIQIKKIQSEIQKLTQNCLTDPEEIIKHLRILSSISKVISAEEYDFYLTHMSQTDVKSQKIITEFINKKIFEVNKIPYTEELSSRFNFTKSKYLSTLLHSHDNFFEGYFKFLCNIVQKDKTKNNKIMFDTLSCNLKTRKIFEQLGVNYDKWVDVDKNSYVKVQVKTNKEKAKQAAIKNLETDLNSALWENIPPEHTQKINNAIKKSGYELKAQDEIQYDNNGFCEDESLQVKRLYKNQNPIKFEDVEKIINAIKEVFNKEDFWNITNPDNNTENARSTLLNHIMKMREKEYQNADKMHDNQISHIEVHKTDMNDITHALFLGNHASCCTAIGSGSNEWSAPAYVIHKCISSIEVMDDKDFVGNKMCYLEDVDNELALVLDNIELNSKYQYNDAIRDAIFEYAKKLCEEIGKPNIHIYAGPHRHKVNMNHLPHAPHNIKIHGATDDDVYIDYLTSGKLIEGDTDTNITLYKVR